jgi:hypothetical protein
MSSRWAGVLQKAILLLSDSQIVTGLAMLVAGFIRSCQLSLYHYQVIVYLAWMASSTHMTAITVLRSYLRRLRPVLNWRVVTMTVMFAMLVAALALTASTVMPSDLNIGHGLFFDSPMSCAWNKEYMRWWPPDVVFSVCLISVGYLSRLSKLFISTSEFFRFWLRDRPSTWLKRTFDIADGSARRSKNMGARFCWRTLATLILGIYVDARSLYDLYESLLSELIWLSFSLFYGVSKTFTWRKDSAVREYENKWGFGQLVPLLLLLLPLVALQEIYAGELAQCSVPTAR